MSARQHLNALFSTCGRGCVELRAVPAGRRTFTTIGDWSRLASFVTDNVRAQQEVYVALATRRDTTNGTVENLAELSAFGIDIDAPPDIVRLRLKTFPFRPSLVVASGSGTHVYFTSKEPLDLTNTTERARVASVLRRLTRYLDGDVRATSPAGVLRLAGTRNFKYDVPRPVTLLEETDHALCACELDEFLPSEIVRNKQLVLADPLPVGARNDTFFRLIRSLRAQGLPMPAITATVRTLNDTYTAEPLSEKELMTLLHHAMTAPNRPDFIVHDAPFRKERA